MFCPNCGTQSQDPDKFCRNCGQSLLTSATNSNDGLHTATVKLSNTTQKYGFDEYIIDQRALNNAYAYLYFMSSIPYIRDDIVYDIWKDFHDENTRIDYVKTTIDELLKIEIYNIKEDLDFQNILTNTKCLISCINDDTDIMIRNFPEFSESLNKLMIDEDTASIKFSTSIHHILNQDMGNTYTSFINILSSLQSRKNQWYECINGEGVSKNVADIATYFASGALAASMPIIGIPALVGKYFMSKKNEATINNVFNEILDLYNKCTDFLNIAYEKRINCCQRIAAFINDKLLNAYTQRDQALQNIFSHEQISTVYLLLLSKDTNNLYNLKQENAYIHQLYMDILLNEHITPLLKSKL